MEANWWENLPHPTVPEATLLEVETVACTTDQWNFPHDRNMPWASDGVCSRCGQGVEMVRVGPDNPSRYSHVAVPHARQKAWLRIDADTLGDLIQYTKEW